MLAAPSRLRKPCDDCFLSLFDLDLEPRGTSFSVEVRARTILRHHAFQTLLRDEVEELLPVFLHVIAKHKLRVSRKNLL